jgi:peptide/nickel transport system permease protein/oligopeptide transport system permease protein
MTRSSMMEVMARLYHHSAIERLVGKDRLKHALRNAFIPIITVIGLHSDRSLGEPLTETVYAWPGIGRLIVDSILARITHGSRDRPDFCLLYILVNLVGYSLCVY